MNLLPRLPCIFDARYCTTAAPTIGTTKQAEVVRAALQEGLLDLRPWTFNATRAWANVARVQEPAYVRAVRRGIPLVINLAGGYQSDGTTVALHVETMRIAAEAHHRRADDISEEELEKLYDKIDAETAKHPPSDDELRREIERMNDTAPRE